MEAQPSVAPEPPGSRPRILVIQLKRIGDVILTAPLLARLREQVPDARIGLAVTDAAAALVPCIPGIDDVFHFRRGQLNFGFWRDFLAARPFDVVLDCDGTDRAVLLAALSGAAVRAAYAKHRKGAVRERIFTHGCGASLKNWHTIDHLAALLDTAGIGGRTPPLRLALTDSIRAEADAFGLPERFALLHPGTARVEKFWPADRWAALIDHLAGDLGWPVVVTGGTARDEAAHLAEIRRQVRSGFLDLTGRTGLAAMGAVVARSSLAVTVDTAALHLAAAFGVPQVALFGPTNPFRWGPRHERAWIVQAGRPEALPADHPFPKPDQFAPMREIRLETVLDVVDRLAAPPLESRPFG